MGDPIALALFFCAAAAAAGSEVAVVLSVVFGVNVRYDAATVSRDLFARPRCGLAAGAEVDAAFAARGAVAVGHRFAE
ncbi:hypothetical protein GCM10023318_57530 [Nocardia callitridis]|uniref:Uncharacterized protein n=1 Tax=Nocardia callitridis TaxID=648753 RepID=A0ABP9L2W7_9NOCA